MHTKRLKTCKQVWLIGRHLSRGRPLTLTRRISRCLSKVVAVCQKATHLQLPNLSCQYHTFTKRPCLKTPKFLRLPSRGFSLHSVNNRSRPGIWSPYSPRAAVLYHCSPLAPALSTAPSCPEPPSQTENPQTNYHHHLHLLRRLTTTHPTALNPRDSPTTNPDAVGFHFIPERTAEHIVMLVRQGSRSNRNGSGA